MKLIPLVLFLLLSTNVFSQSAFNIVKVARNATRPNVICRTITIRTSGLYQKDGIKLVLDDFLKMYIL